MSRIYFRWRSEFGGKAFFPTIPKFTLVRIGRISFSHDSAVRLMFREWTLLDEQRLEARLLMATTVTRRLMEHTSVIYKKIYP
ncbi:unnamed protein product [Nippostrongylus brasiliensis]|uniref:DUF982 domain-containing protein n=1 Tax=Nippostrongylus brasiliensis TaxID=27835 RepID=A0A0N4YU85_NIPBR|nr:unnamed protein product [Nippostrongylus brasiliensis]